ncbi:tripartite tricarboxylate transporter substrate binding protein [Desulfoluna spongiiphila]|uniref:Tripartite-type tricarboxylate transporter, receptor component TctC n=1 Tax=Desulfoluna spongiiphila TaxID=419481 RepID=A0A1G5FKU5_9BACT|nr:tripartite tricarboxylate transporter substrate binding protein [Desulfoluna spongiiphila]SCY39952.1 Tripartite-type tricarboxylate transporter, receptor component TctC [Desulfoluna spongiiphila]VVS95544.1 bordetella uptake gene [Desulfoluna spongiiphila]
MRKVMTLVLALSLALPLSLSTAFAGKYPSKPIKIIVPSKAGGSTDTGARLFIKAAKKYWPDAKFVIKNVPGSGGQKGFEEIAKGRKDGYTIGMIFTTQVVAHVVAKRARYTLDSFHVMGNVMQDPLIVAVPKNSDITDMAGFIKAAKAGSLTTAVNGIGSDDFVAAKKLEQQTGVSFNLLPTKGSTEQKAMILGGHVDASVMNLSQLQAQHKAGTARIIAILDENRSDILPEVKTAGEQGFPVTMTATRGFVAPAGVDKKILASLDDLLAKVQKDEEFIAECTKDVFFLLPMNGVDYLAYLTDLQAETQTFYDQNPW